jgi:hypothetical protein
MREKIYVFLVNNFCTATMIFIVLLFFFVLELMFKPRVKSESNV